MLSKHEKITKENYMEVRLSSIKGIPLKYIQSILKIDENSPSGLTWLPRNDRQFNHSNQYAGNINTYKKKNYSCWKLSLAYKGKSYSLKCSRIIFLLKHGYLTDGKIVDHADGNPLNNKVDNLREVTEYQNNQNSKLPKTNTSGHKGVHWDAKSKKWRVLIYANGKFHHFGLYENKEDAIKVAIEARKKLHGEFAKYK